MACILQNVEPRKKKYITNTNNFKITMRLSMSHEH